MRLQGTVHWQGTVDGGIVDEADWLVVRIFQDCNLVGNFVCIVAHDAMMLDQKGLRHQITVGRSTGLPWWIQRCDLLELQVKLTFAIG